MNLKNKFSDIKNFLYGGVDMTPYYEDIFDRASQCDTVVEFGIHIGNSTKAIICALPKKYIGYDPHPMLQSRRSFINNRSLHTYARENGVEFIVELKSSHDADFEEADMLFIDSIHVYSFLLKELDLHAHKIKKYIGMHDTKMHDHKSDLSFKGKTKDDESKGLMDAISEFLAIHPEWEIDKHNIDGEWGCLWLKRKYI